MRSRSAWQRALGADLCHVTCLSDDLGCDQDSDAGQIGQPRFRARDRASDLCLVGGELLIEAAQLGDSTPGQLGPDRTVASQKLRGLRDVLLRAQVRNVLLISGVDHDEVAVDAIGELRADANELVTVVNE